MLTQETIEYNALINVNKFVDMNLFGTLKMYTEWSGYEENTYTTDLLHFLKCFNVLFTN